jgi:hypothetical protein
MAKQTSKAAASARTVGTGSRGVKNVGNLVDDIPQNPNFIHFNPRGFHPPRPTKTVIVTQDPAPGDFVPSGTPVSVTVVEKGIIPPKSFNGISQTVIDKYATISALEDDLNKPGDPVALAAKTALDTGVPFDQLSDADKNAVTAYVNHRGIAGADAGKAARDVAMLFQL